MSTSNDGKPRCQLTGTDGNIFALGARAGAALKKAGLKVQAEEMYHKISQSKSYGEALVVISEYVHAY
jgi:hypothetical protein